MFWINNAYAMGAGQQAGQEPNLLASFTPFILIFAVFYFLIIRPQQKKAKEHKAMLGSLKKGDAIITAGGLYGRIVEAGQDTVVVDLGETKVTMGRAYIASVPAGKDAGAAPKKDLKKDKKKDKAEETAPVPQVEVVSPAAQDTDKQQ